MGAYLSSPICDKDTVEDSNDRLAFAASSMQGWRMSQEVSRDLEKYHTHQVDLVFRTLTMLFLTSMRRHHYSLFTMVTVVQK